MEESQKLDPWEPGGWKLDSPKMPAWMLFSPVGAVFFWSSGQATEKLTSAPWTLARGAYLLVSASWKWPVSVADLLHCKLAALANRQRPDAPGPRPTPMSPG